MMLWILRPNPFATALMVGQRGFTRRLSKDYGWLSSIYQQVLLTTPVISVGNHLEAVKNK